MDINKKALADVDSFHECLYSWELLEDPFAATTSEQVPRLKEVFESFTPEKSPDERKIELLKDSMQEFDKILSEADGSSWTDSQAFKRLPDGDVVNLRQHRLLALRQHLQWICDVFGDVPGANVTCR